MKVPCPQCGGEVPLREAAGFPRCPYCDAGLVLDPTGVRRHYLYRARLRPAELLPLLRRWADGQHLAAAGLTGPPRLRVYPFWRFAGPGPAVFEPAWEAPDSRWEAVEPPEGEQGFFDPARLEGAQVVEATLPEESARRRRRIPEGVPAGDLVHIPFYEGSLRARRGHLAVLLDACSGRVYAAEGRWEGSLRGGLGEALGLGGALALAVATLLPAFLALPALSLIGVILYTWLRRPRAGAGS